VILDLDFGNTAGKWRIVDAEKVVSRGFFDYLDLASFFQDLPKVVRRIRAVSVLSIQHQRYLFQEIEACFSLSIEYVVVAESACGLINGYEDPQRLGADRWVAMVAAWQYFRCGCLVVDAGSALTIDCIDSQGKHCGGYIIPGLILMQDALNAKTGKIQIDNCEVGLMPGINTRQAVGHGSILAMVSAIKAVYDSFEQQLSMSPALVVTGGDAKTLLPYLSPQAVHYPDLVFDGLGLILP
jgi:type III pantothenate kinase